MQPIISAEADYKQNTGYVCGDPTARSVLAAGSRSSYINVIESANSGLSIIWVCLKCHDSVDLEPLKGAFV